MTQETRICHVKNLQKVNLNALGSNDPVVLKVKEDIPDCGYVIRFQKEVLDARRKVRTLFEDSILFVERIDYSTFLESLPNEPGVAFNLASSGVALKVARDNKPTRKLTRRDL